MPVQPPTIVEIRAKMLLFQSKHKLDFTPMGIDSRCYKFFNSSFLCIRLSREFFIQVIKTVIFEINRAAENSRCSFLKHHLAIQGAYHKTFNCDSFLHRLLANLSLILFLLFLSLCRGKIVLGYSETELCMKGSGYQFIHAADMMYCADSHLRSMLAIYSQYLVSDGNALCLSHLELFSHYKGSPVKNIWTIFTSFMRCY